MKAKKSLALMLAVAFVVSLCAVPAFAQNENVLTLANSDYLRYNAETGEIDYYSFDDIPDATGGASSAYSPGYLPASVLEISLEYNQASPFALIGDEDRTKVTTTTVGPYANTVCLEIKMPNQTPYNCTGFMIGPYALATAAHCIWNATAGMAEYVKVMLAKNGDLNPYGSETVTADSFVLSAAYVNSGGSSNEDDWAVIELSTDLGNRTGWLGLRYQAGSYNNTFVYCTGYPQYGSHPEQNEYSTFMFVGTGYIRESEDKYLYGDFDATGGNSGGPVFANYYNTGYTAIGILTAGWGEQGGEYPASASYVTRFTESLYNFLLSYRTSPVY